MTGLPITAVKQVTNQGMQEGGNMKDNGKSNNNPTPNNDPEPPEPDKKKKR